MSPVSPTARNTNILTPREVSICKAIADLDIKLLSLRAQALLLMNGGYTQADTASETGMSIGQVRYLMIIFNKKGISIFPKSLLEAVKTEKKAPLAKPQPVAGKPEDEAPEEKPPATKQIKAETKVKTGKKKKKEKAKKESKPGKSTKKDKKKKGKKKKK